MTSLSTPLRALDTSVILRYLIGDIPELAERARRLIDSDTPLGIPAVALLEASHVLRNPPYSFSRASVVDALTELLQRENVRGVGIDADMATAALGRCRTSSAVSFGDALIAATCWSTGIAEVYTFDARFSRSGAESITPPPADGP